MAEATHRPSRDLNHRPDRALEQQTPCYAAVRPAKRGITIKESTMNMKTNNTNNSATSENRELTDDELNAASGGIIVVCGAVNAYFKADSASPALRKAG